jgi:hypothetical protein
MPLECKDTGCHRLEMRKNLFSVRVCEKWTRTTYQVISKIAKKRRSFKHAHRRNSGYYYPSQAQIRPTDEQDETGRAIPMHRSLFGPMGIIQQVYSRLYWYRGVTVLLPGWVIWKYWNCPCKFFSLGSWLVSALSTHNGGEGYNSSPDLNSNTITSIQLQYIQASRPHLADKPTSKPQTKYYMSHSSPHQPPYCTYAYEINIQKEWHWPPNI